MTNPHATTNTQAWDAATMRLLCRLNYTLGVMQRRSTAIHNGWYRTVRTVTR